MSEVVQEPEAEVTESTEPVTGDEDEPLEPLEPPPPDEDEPEAQAPPAPVIDEAAMEKFYKSLATRTTTFNNWLSNELGENANDLSPCPLCADGIMGHIYPPDWIQPTSDLQARLLDVLKTPSAPEYLEAPNARRCASCDGWGVVLSGSRKAGQERVQCPICDGRGFVSHGAVVSAGNGASPALELVTPVEDAPLVADNTDIWGSPKILPDGQENPNYGKMPQYKNPTLP